MDTLAERLQKAMRGHVLVGAPLAEYTSFRIGGPAMFLAVPSDREDLKMAKSAAW
jgi:UDP-N-acetylenolpyruvoylglucosamine reductase